MTPKEIMKQATKMPVLLERTLVALTPEHRDAFIAAFANEVAKKEAVSKRVNLALGRPEDWKPQRPNFTRDTERALSNFLKGQKGNAE